MTRLHESGAAMALDRIEALWNGDPTAVLGEDARHEVNVDALQRAIWDDAVVGNDLYDSGETTNLLEMAHESDPALCGCAIFTDGSWLLTRHFAWSEPSDIHLGCGLFTLTARSTTRYEWARDGWSYESEDDAEIVLPVS